MRKQKRKKNMKENASMDEDEKWSSIVMVEVMKVIRIIKVALCVFFGLVGFTVSLTYLIGILGFFENPHVTLAAPDNEEIRQHVESLRR